MLIKQNVNNDVTKDLPISTTFKTFYQFTRALKSHAVSVSLTHFHIISRSHEYFSRIYSTLLEGNFTVLDVRSAYNRKIPSIEVVNVLGFNKLVHFRQFQKCKQTHYLGNHKLESSAFSS